MEPQDPSLNPKLRLLCSYGGRIMLNSLQYIGGDTRLVSVPRDISFPAFFELLSNKLLSGRSFFLKYKLPGCDLDSLITVSNNDDLQNMIAEYDSTRSQRIRLFLFPLDYPDEPSRNPKSVNRSLGLELPIQKIAFTTSSSVVPIPIFPPNNGPPQFAYHDKVSATVEENRKRDETPITSASPSLLPPENTTSAVVGGVSGREREIQDRPRPIIQEGLPQQQPFIMCYLPIWPMQPNMINHPVATYTLSPAKEHSSWLDPVAENQENGT